MALESRWGLLVAAALVVSGCYEHHTADAAALELEPVVEPSSEQPGDGGVATGETVQVDLCADIADDDILGQVFCDFSQSGRAQTGNVSATGQLDLASLLSVLAGGGNGAVGTGQLDLVGLLGVLAGGGNTTTGTGQLDLVSLLGVLAGGGNTAAGTGQLDLVSLLGVLAGGGNAGTGAGQLDLASLLGLVGGLTGTGGGTAGAGQIDLAALLGALGGNRRNTPSTPAPTGRDGR